MFQNAVAETVWTTQKPVAFSGDVSKPLDLLMTGPAEEDLESPHLKDGKPSNPFALSTKQILTAVDTAHNASGRKVSPQTVRNRLKPFDRKKGQN